MIESEQQVLREALSDARRYVATLERAVAVGVQEIAQLRTDLVNARADREDIWSRWQASKVMR